MSQEKVLIQGLRELGYIDRQNIPPSSYRRAAGKVERLTALARRFVRLVKVQVMVVHATPVIPRAPKIPTTTIPIVMLGAAVRWGADSSRAWRAQLETSRVIQTSNRSLQGRDLNCSERLFQNSPAAFWPTVDPAYKLFVEEAQGAGEGLKIQIRPTVIDKVEEIEGASQQ